MKHRGDQPIQMWPSAAQQNRWPSKRTNSGSREAPTHSRTVPAVDSATTQNINLYHLKG